MEDENQSECQSQLLQEQPKLIKRPSSIWKSNYDENREWSELNEECNAFEQQFYGLILQGQMNNKKSQGDIKSEQWDSESSFDWYCGYCSKISIKPDPPIEPIPLIKPQPKPQSQKDRHKKQSKFPNKSFCRYILLYAFRALEKQQYADTIQEICSRNNVNFEIFRAYYTKQRLVILGYQVLSKELIINKDNNKEVVQRKKAFQEYLIWYLDRIATKDILSSKKKDLKEYIKYKNQVLCYYIRFPDQWKGNKAEWL